MSTDAVQPEVRTSPFSSPMTRFEGAIIMLTSSDSELYKMEITFRNVRPNKQGGFDPLGDPMVNDFGINRIIGLVQSVVNRITFLSNVNQNEVVMISTYLAEVLAKDLMINRTRYGITDFATRDKIYFMVMGAGYLALKRAFEEGDKRFLKGSLQEIHTKVDSGPKKAGPLSALNPWRKD